MARSAASAFHGRNVDRSRASGRLISRQWSAASFAGVPSSRLDRARAGPVESEHPRRLMLCRRGRCRHDASATTSWAFSRGKCWSSACDPHRVRMARPAEWPGVAQTCHELINNASARRTRLVLACHDRDNSVGDCRFCPTCGDVARVPAPRGVGSRSNTPSQTSVGKWHVGICPTTTASSGRRVPSFPTWRQLF